MRTAWIALLLTLSACGQTQLERAATNALPISEPPIARCMNLGNALEAPQEGDWGYTVRREDLVRLQIAGFDSVRLPVNWSEHTRKNAPYEISRDMLARVDEIIGWANEIGLKIIVNVHHYEDLNNLPDVHEPRLEAIWDQLSAHFARAPPTLIFETINEPHTNMSVARTDALNTRILARIRQNHPDRWVIWGTAEWGSLDGLEAALPQHDPRIMLTYHEYAPYHFTHQGAPWGNVPQTRIQWGTRRDVSRMMQNLDKAVAVQTRTRMPVFVGEFGVYDGVPIEQRARWVRTLREGLEERGLAWCHWDFAGSLHAYNLEQEKWIPEIKAALLD
ncbi:MAG: glycoside hydrolase family 5 protein [Pseudomonadota bacterium]